MAEEELIKKVVKETLEQRKTSHDPECPLSLLDKDELDQHKGDHEDWREFKDNAAAAKTTAKWILGIVFLWALRDLYDTAVVVGKGIYQFIHSLPKGS